MEIGETYEKNVKEECYLCGHLCNPKRMLAHIRSHTNVEIFECEICGDRFASKSTLQKHYISHKTHFICEHCNKKFLDPERLKSHKCFDAEDGFTCNICGKEFLHKSRLLRHSASHSDEKPFKCEFCDKRFRFKGSLTVHLSKHRKNENGEYVKETVVDKSFACAVCNKEFPNKRNLERHYLCHTNEKPYVCDICLRGFALKHNMENHARLHFINEKPYQCDKCNKCFNRKSNLTVHYDMHYRRENGLPPRKVISKQTHKCETCKKTFISRRNLIQHQVSHTKEKNFICQFCNQKFSYDSSLKRHLFVHTEGAFRKRLACKKKNVYPKNKDGEEIYMCSTCKKLFDSEVELLNHKRCFLQESKKYKCCKCLQVFKTKKALREHQKIHEMAVAPVPIVCAVKVEVEED